MSVASPSFWRRLPIFGNLGYPIARKEVRSLLRRNRFFWAQFVYLIVLGFAVVSIVWTSSTEHQSQQNVSRQLFYVFFSLQHFLVLLIFPAFAATSISGERVEKSFDLLITTDLRPTEIVWGKFFGIFGNCCFFLLVTLPLLGTIILFGGVEPILVLENYAVLMLEAATLSIYGLVVSASSPSNIRAILGTYTLVFLIGFLTFFAIVNEFTEVSSPMISVSSILEQANASWPPLASTRCAACFRSCCCCRERTNSKCISRRP